MAKTWKYEAKDANSGTLLLTDGPSGRAIVRIESSGPGHCYDTGHMIAAALNEYEAARNKAGKS